MIGKRRHLIPQQMIRRFVDGSGMLYCLDKSSGKILPKPKPPKSILYREDYYKGQFGDFDLELLGPIENRFGKHFDKLVEACVEHRTLPNKPSEAFVEWILALTVRTEYFERIFEKLVLDQEVEPPFDQVSLRPDILNDLRAELFDHQKELFTSPRFCWQSITITQSSFVLTDHPLLTQASEDGTKLFICVPLTSKVMVIGGHPEALASPPMKNVAETNLNLTAHAGRYVYSGTRAELELLQRAIWGDDGRPLPGMDQVTKPYGGKLDQIPPDSGQDHWETWKRELGHPTPLSHKGVVS